MFFEDKLECINEKIPTIMIVDDSPDNITLFSELLKNDYNIKVALNGERALKLIKNNPPDIILLDVMMPVLDGLETCKILKNDEAFKEIPVIFLTSKSEAADESIGLKLGAVDYITKPINPDIFLSRIKTQLSIKQANDFLKNKNTYLEAEVLRRTEEITLLQEVSIMSLASLAETRDNETGYHIQRTKLYVKELCEYLLSNGKFQDVLNPKTIKLIVASVPLHDIGKVGIPDSILLKPGKLTDAEFEIIKTHTTLGKDAITRAEKLINQHMSFFDYPKEIVYCHHEKWDGSGYPQGISAETIPLSARLVALADVYDALRSKRVYKPGYSHKETVNIIKNNSGKHFDPDIVQAFLDINEKFDEIARRYKMD